MASWMFAKWPTNIKMTSKKRITNKQTYSIIAGIFTLVLFAILAISSILLQKNLRQSQDIRQEAFEANGSVVLSTFPSAGHSFAVNQPVTVQVLFNTNGVGIDGIQLIGTLTGQNTLLNNPEITQANSLNGMSIVKWNLASSLGPNSIQQLSNNLLAITNNPSQLYSSTTEQLLYTYTFTPTTTGEFTVSFGEESFATRSINDAQVDELALDNNNSVPSFTFYVIDSDVGITPSVSPNPSVSPSPSLSPTPTLPPTVSSCPAPANFTIVEDSISCRNNNTLSVTLNWQAVAGASQYLIFGYDLNNPANQLLYTRPAGSGSTNSYTINNLSEGTWIFTISVYQANSTICLADGENFSTIIYTFNCEDEQLYCNYNSCVYGTCTNGYRNVTCAVSSNSDPACAPTISYNEPCAVQCTYSCSPWSECRADRIQSRTCTATNTPCWDYSGNNRGNSYTETRYCDVTNVSDLVFASYEACWYGNSNGVSTYVAWGNGAYPNARWVDISPHADFSRFAHKNVTGADISNGYGITNGQEFYWNDNGSRFYFEPETTYYARLYYFDGSNHRHSRTVTFRMARCAGSGGVSYRQCNDSCSNNSDCATGLACISGRCRLSSNPSSEYCVDPTALKGCAQWCADSRECQSGLTCWYNYCRNPRNIDIKVTNEHRIAQELDKERQNNCADWKVDPKAYYYIYYSPANQAQTKGGLKATTTTTGTKTSVKACNEYCSSNAQCPMNMRCYNNACRLALNPQSAICDLKDKTGTKGGTTNTDQEKITPTRDPNKTYLDDETQTSFVEDEADDQDIVSQTALDAIREYLSNKGISLQTLAIIAGGLFLLLIVLIVLAIKDQSKPVSRNNLTMPPSTLKTVSQPPVNRTVYSQPTTNQTMINRPPNIPGGNQGYIPKQPMPPSSTQKV